MVKTFCNVLIEVGIISLIIFPPLVFGAIQFRYITYIQVMILAIGLVWAIKTFVKGSLTYTPTPFDLPILAFVVLGIINVWTSTYRHNTERELYLVFNYALLYFLVVQQLRTARRILGLAFIIVLIGSGESVFGLLQYLRGATTVLGYATPNIGTVNATYFSHNHFAGFLNMVIPVALGLGVGAANLEKKFFLFLLIGLMGSALILTLSRGGLLSFFLASGVFCCCLVFKKMSAGRQRSSLRSVMLGMLLLVFCMIGYVKWIGISPIAHRSLLNTFFPTEESVQQEIRFAIWKNGLALVKEFPVLGSGLGTFEFVFLRYRPKELPDGMQAFHAHNDYLELLLETGFPGLLIVLWALVRFGRYVLRGYFQRSDPVLAPLALGGFTACTAMCIHSFFDFNLQIPANALLFFIVAAMTSATVQLITRDHHERNTRHFDRSWLFVVGVVLVVGILLFNFRTNLAMRYFNQAKLAQYQNRPFDAIPFYQKAIAIDRDDPLFRTSLGELYNDLAKKAPHAEKWHRLAVQEYQRAIALNKYDATFYYALGWTYDALDRTTEAVQAFKTAIAYNPGWSFYHEQLGRYALSLGQIDPAIDAFHNALQINPRRMSDIVNACKQEKLSYQEYQHLVPDNAESHKMFAEFLAQQGDWENSKAEYNKAIELSGKQTKYYEAMLAACRAHHDYPCMRILWQELGAQDPQNLEFPMNIAESFVQQQLWDEAIKHYQTLLANDPDQIQIHQRLAQLYQQQGHTYEAIKEYTNIIDIQPDRLDSYHAIANLYRQKQLWNAAINIYEKALEHGLTQAVIYANLGDLYVQTGNENKAITLYDQAVRAGETRIIVYQALEQLYQTSKRKADVDLLWNTYIMTNKQHPDALFQLVTHYQNHGEWLKAVTLCKELIANAPTNAGYRKFLANLYEQKGMLFETIGQWEELVNMDANNITYHLYLAQLYERAAQVDNARMQYRTILRLQPNHQQAQQKLTNLGG
jgi:tetratricopeptide (TPR) repeat protein/O-antigen ligase